ncbi:class I SAM-dependent methyltransferase [Candidatus Kryptobacter tengchongensis]|uniref:Ubiquinone/menaquinone biosynthesis C-methylase UbiE n=1 Tax=Kryptobacter tengchongensis TaxID=1643429 RepID=A0A656D3E4_KRYT1|nr:class I SAM-dependent methyltransferase [Candidatus Kryptobacter tengchongensis]CUS98324.1 Ubiquinone/menaquinone biosynthesis C-methylase UbiE [Candidatus Kryptobacter tengchongensis]
MNRLKILKHFAEIAPVYRHVRTLDPEPIFAIKDILVKHKKWKKPLKIADIGAGTGRYTELLIKILKPENVKTILVDASFEMLSVGKTHMGRYNAHFVNSLAEHLPFKNEVFDVIMVFNAIHHFDFKKFIREARRILKTGGFIFIYTRTQEQNRNSIWGQYFPKFSEKEYRLFWKDELIKKIKRLKNFKVISYIEFEYPRISTIDELLKKAFAKHYSTFYLYKDDEYAQAIEMFKENLMKYYEPDEQIIHTDENTLVGLRKISRE